MPKNKNLFVSATNAVLPNAGEQVRTATRGLPTKKRREANKKLKESKELEKQANSENFTPSEVAGTRKTREEYLQELRGYDDSLEYEQYKLSEKQWSSIKRQLSDTPDQIDVLIAYHGQHDRNVNKYNDHLKASAISASDPHMALVSDAQNEATDGSLKKKTLSTILAADGKIDLATAKMHRYNAMSGFISELCTSTGGLPSIDLGGLQADYKESLGGAIIRGFAASIGSFGKLAASTWGNLMNCKDFGNRLSHKDLGSLIKQSSNSGDVEIAAITIAKSGKFTSPNAVVDDAPGAVRSMLGMSRSGSSLNDVTDALDELGISPRDIVKGEGGSVDMDKFQAINGKRSPLADPDGLTLRQRMVVIAEEEQRALHVDKTKESKRAHAIGNIVEMDQDEADMSLAVLAKAQKGKLPSTLSGNDVDVDTAILLDKGDGVTALVTKVGETTAPNNTLRDTSKWVVRPSTIADPESIYFTEPDRLDAGSHFTHVYSEIALA